MKVEKCKNCTFYSAYYQQWSDHYGRLNHGFCSKHQKSQTQFEFCQNFISNEQKEKRREERLLFSLEQASKSINEIAVILNEKYKSP